MTVTGDDGHRNDGHKIDGHVTASALKVAETSLPYTKWKLDQEVWNSLVKKAVL